MTATEEIAESQSRLKSHAPFDPTATPESPEAEALETPEASPAPEAKPEAKPESKVPDLDASLDNFRNVLLRGMPDKKREPAKKDEAQPDADKAPEQKPDKPAEAAKAEAPAEPEKKPVKVTRKATEPPRPSMEEIAAEAAARTVAAMRPAHQEPAKPEPSAVPKEYAKQLEVFTAMSEENPAAFGDLPNKLRTFIRKEDSYIEAWQKENPGKEFNSADEDHNDFYRRNEPVYDEDAYDSAKTQIAAKPMLEKEAQRIRGEFGEKLKRVDEMEAKETERALVPRIITEQKAAMAKILETINPDYAAMAEDPKQIEKLATDDGGAYELAMQAANQTLPFVAEVVKLWDGEGKIKTDMDNPLHRHIYDYERDVAKRIKSLPSDDQVNANGQRFASWAEYQTLTATEQKNRWVMGRNELIHVRQQDAIGYISGVVNLAKRLSGGNAAKPSASKPPQSSSKDNGVPKPESKPEPPKETASPSMGGKTTIRSTGGTDKPASENWADRFNSVMAGRTF